MNKPPYICVICGATFTPKAANAKYCSEHCRQRGKYQKRREWEQKSGYIDRQREKMRQYRDDLTEEERQQAEKAAARKARSEKARETRRKNKELQELTARAEQGDALARLDLAARNGNTSFGYWEAFKDYHLQEAEKRGRQSGIMVNGIDINDPDFALSVTITIGELGRISTTGSDI